MKYSIALLAALFSHSEAATAKLYTQNASKKTIQTVSAKPATGAAYTLEVPLGEGVDYIVTSLTGYDMTCNWLYKAAADVPAFQIAKDLDFCDYPTRTMSSKTVTVTMPIAGIPEFDMEGASLILDCQMGTTKLSKVTPDCDKKASDDIHQKRSFFSFYEESSGKPVGTIEAIVWAQSLINFGIQGASPCLTWLSDWFDIYYYLVSSMHPMNELAHEEGLMIASAVGQSFADGYYCVKSFGDDGKFWNSEANFWYLLFNDGFSGSWEALPDDIYSMSFLLQIAGSVLILLEDPDYLWLEVPRLMNALQKNLYYYFTPNTMEF